MHETPYKHCLTILSEEEQYIRHMIETNQWGKSSLYNEKDFGYFNIYREKIVEAKKEVSMLHVDAEPYETAELMRFK